MPVIQFSITEAEYIAASGRGEHYNVSANRIGKGLYLLWLQNKLEGAEPEDVLGILRLPIPGVPRLP